MLSVGMDLLERYRSTFARSSMSRDPLDVAQAVLLVASTIYATRGIHPPHVANKAERHRRDLLAWSSATAPYVLTTLCIGTAAFQAYSILHLDAGQWSGKARTVHAALCLLSCFGGWLRLRCYRELGRFFTFAISIRKEYKIIQTGPYKYLRHPSYTAILILIMSQVLLTLAANPVAHILPSQLRLASIAVTALGPPVLVAIRIQQEEEMLNESFGTEYKEYSKRTHRLIPFIY